MSFFGLTALGPQEVFASQSKDFAILNIFSLEEFKIGFDTVGGSSGEISIDEVEEVLSIVYHGPAPSPEITKFYAKLGRNRDTPIQWPEFASAYESLCNEIKSHGVDQYSRIGSAANFQSYDELQLATKKHTRAVRGPKDVLVSPLTAVQEIGWNATEFIEKRTVHGKKSCPETVYASELIKSGVFY